MQETRPRLAKGRHKRAGHEACVMELVSLVAGEPWSDHPRCVHPVLGAVARAVNDRVSDAGRDTLAALVPRLAGSVGAGPLLGARLVVMCTEAALKNIESPQTDSSQNSPKHSPQHDEQIETIHELTSARRTALYLLSRGAVDKPGESGDAPEERPRCPWPVRTALWLLDHTRMLARVYGYDAELQVAFAVSQIESEPERLALLEACTDTAVRWTAGLKSNSSTQ
jgi:hypothetical protein